LTINGAGKPAAADLEREPLALDDLLDNGQAVGRIGGLVAFVTGGLPGEQVRISVDAIKRNHIAAHATEIEVRSRDRITSICPVFPECGGCQVLHLRYAAQLEWKRRMVEQALHRIGGLTGISVCETHRALEMPAGYRNKVTLVSKFFGGSARLGFYAARSHRVVPIDSCPVLVPRLDDAVRQLIALARQEPNIFSRANHVVARASTTTPDLVVSFNGERPNKALGEAVDLVRSRIPHVTGIVSNWQPESANAVFGKRFAVLWGSPMTRERVASAELKFGIASFFQINTPVLEAIAQRLMGTLSGADRVVDLYCGVGTFGVILGKRGIPSTGVESYRPAVDEAAANAAANGVTCAAFECAPVAEAVAGDRGRSLFAGARALILDPPRKGCDPEVIEAVTRFRPPIVEYVSCNPATLARDAKGLVAAGYRLESVTPFDMFPQTGHVEALAEFALHG